MNARTEQAVVGRLRLRPRARRWMVLLHVVVSVGWIGVEVSILALGVAGVASDDPAVVTGSRVIAGLLAGTFYAPASALTLITGIWLGLGTRWGLVRHYWLLAKLVLTIALFAGGNIAVVPEFSGAADIAAAGGDVGDTGTMLITAMSAGLTLLLFASMLSVIKPWGRTRWYPAPKPQSSNHREYAGV